jgi:hypothetical protein
MFVFCGHAGSATFPPPEFGSRFVDPNSIGYLWTNVMVCITSSGETAATEAQREMMMDLSVGSAAAHKGLVNNNGKYKRNGRGRSR